MALNINPETGRNRANGNDVKHLDLALPGRTTLDTSDSVNTHRVHRSTFKHRYLSSPLYFALLVEYVPPKSWVLMSRNTRRRLSESEGLQEGGARA